MLTLLKSLWKDESGQATVEYALVLGMVALGVSLALLAFKDQLVLLWGALKNSLVTQTNAVPK